MRLFLDANILFSAAYFPGTKVEQFMKDAILSHSVLLSTEYAVSEARKNLSAKHPAGLLKLNFWLLHLELVQAPGRTHCPIDLPVKDQPIFMAAIVGHATHLITGDLQHFGKWMNKPKQTQGIVIQTIGDFLKTL